MEPNYDFEKSVYWSIKSIENLHSEDAFKVNLNGYPLHECTALTEKKEEFECKFVLDKIHGSEYLEDSEKFGIYEKILLSKNGDNYVINKNSITSLSITLSNPQVITAKTTNFQTHENDFFDNKTLRLCIISDIEPDFGSFEAKSLKVNKSIIFSGLLEVNVGKRNYHVFKDNNEYNNLHFIFIDSVEENTFDEFRINTKAILLAFAIITGNLFQNEIYYQVIHNDNVTLADATAYYKEEKSIYTNNALFNPYRFLEYIKDINYQLPDGFSVMLPRNTFNSLCNGLLTSNEFARCCLLTLEGNESKFSLLKASIYSIALETITNIVYEENKSKLNPIQDKKLFDKIKAKLNSVIDEYDVFIPEYASTILRAKFNDLNKPTNSKKLSFPFDFYRIKLSDEDLKILNHRNKFLHGTSPFKETEIKSKIHELDYIIAKLRFMVYALILKRAGYRGHIINFPSWLQYNRKKEITEHLFLII
jgi:hypothetical protein